MGGLALTSCNDFLDRSPISDITPEDYFNTVDQVGSYVINYYDDYLENSNTTKMYHQRAWISELEISGIGEGRKHTLSFSLVMTGSKSKMVSK